MSTVASVVERGAGFPVRATYRIQFHEEFGLVEALSIIPYLHDLGVSHIYASPLTTARSHSKHGYDVCDFQRLNPEIGTEADFENLTAALRDYKMGLVLDIVPNHMAADYQNAWWRDVLTHGRSSGYAKYFDINWESTDPRTKGKVVLPILEEDYSRAMGLRKIQLKAESCGMSLYYLDHRLPISPNCPVNQVDVTAINADLDALDLLIQSQHYRLVYWKRGDAELNYRRFFNITSLAGLRVEDQEVFAASHVLVKKWAESRRFDGLRVDHPDGLCEPTTYLQRLRSLAPDAWIVIEKILGAGEPLPSFWPVEGTTGYDFLHQTNALLVQPQGEDSLKSFYEEFTGEKGDYETLRRDKKRAALDEMFPAEINRLVEIAARIANSNWRWRDFTTRELREAISELAACFPVYRIYGDDLHKPSDAARAYVEQAVTIARRQKPELPVEIFEMFNDTLLRKVPGDDANDFANRFQQLSGAAMAKGVEDTAFYCYNRFVSLNEVGGDPDQFGQSVETFHRICATQQHDWPETMLASTTHDTKRSEDVRARLNVLSEIPSEWSSAVQKWAACNERHRRDYLPDRNAEYLFYQTLVGAWPISLERMHAYCEKAAREAKQYTNWFNPNVYYEQALRHFVRAAMNDAGFMEQVEQFVASIAMAGFINSLSQTLIKLAAPGIPDIYQGCELWNFSLVDPDNRQPVDFETRRLALGRLKGTSGAEVWRREVLGLAKLWLIWKTLNLRAESPELFAGGMGYEPLFAGGQKRKHVIAFKRGEGLIAVAQRWPMKLQGHWEETSLNLPDGKWLNVFTAESVTGGSVLLKVLLKLFPVALLRRKTSGS